ncbi:MAG: regulatory protein RecX [Candidatus Cloacimonetes bacterium]|jgi:regulatory protein|nr:recombination regulator RecX [Candidatus Cloacimonadota bacterium]MDD4148157.1 regulatory protein RecX [Candidatus Cloacimonadota bacterium]MDD4559204.1 regulatory protein RecX [Candidatus Cloacimonadota bacterium]
MILKYWTKNKRLSYLSLDNELWGVLPTGTLHYLFPFAAELQIDESRTEELKNELRKRAWAQITEYLAKSEHSEYQCRNYLYKQQYHVSIIEQCIGICKDKHYIDDRRFATLYISALLERGKSRRAILQKLSEHRIPREICDELIQELDEPEQNLGKLIEQISALLHKYRDEEPRKAKEKIFASLYRKGFDLDMINEAWREIHQ